MPTMATINGTAVWVGQNGHTLYEFSIDGNDVSNCTSSNGCTGVWPPYTAPAGTTVPSGSQFSVFVRGDGTTQWAVSGHPLYEYSGDTAAGQINGNGIVSFGGSWSDATASASAAPTSTPTPSGYIRNH
jgi:predicted lipoprotein with Yx(FWY)xxD motif